MTNRNPPSTAITLAPVNGCERKNRSTPPRSIH